MIRHAWDSADWKCTRMVTVPGEARSLPISTGTMLLSVAVYHGLAVKLKDALVHFDNPSSAQLRWLWHSNDNRDLNVAKNSDSRIRDLSNYLRQLHHSRFRIRDSNKDSPLNLTTCNSTKGPLCSLERENRINKDFVLFVASWPRKVNLSQVPFKFNSDSSRTIRAIQTEEINGEISETNSAAFK
ncbi:hypothetical protein BASA83_013264 [Batrachochytrium salamandrivorans]|nr:hypothetical protein BASA83_013264 [Batrachochytrium salamandrivorans]